MILGLKSVDCCVNVTLKVLRMRIVSNEGGWRSTFGIKVLSLVKYSHESHNIPRPRVRPQPGGPMPNNLFCRSSPISERENRKLSTVINFMEI